MTRVTLLRKTPDWEKARPERAVYEHFFYNSHGEVRKVKGKITVVTSVCRCGQKTMTTMTRDVRWDGLGRCYVGIHNVRNRNYDIHFK